MTPTELSLLAMLTAAAQLICSTALLFSRPPLLPPYPPHKCKCRAHTRLCPTACSRSNCTGATLLRASSRLSLTCSQTWRTRIAIVSLLLTNLLCLQQVARYAWDATFRCCGSYVMQLPLTFVQPAGFCCNCFVLRSHTLQMGRLEWTVWH